MVTRKRTTRDVMMTMPMNTDEIDVVTSVDDDDEKDFSIQIQRHADMQMSTRPDIQACRGTQRNVRKSYKSTPPTSHFRAQRGPGRPEGRFDLPKASKGCLLGGVQNRLDLRSAHFLLEK